MPLAELHGHDDLRRRLAHNIASGSLPSSLLLHGPRGVGKQRLALWVAQALLCTGENPPCGECQSCKYSRNVAHPDLHWYFPRTRLKDPDPSLEDVKDDYREAITERLANHGLYPPPPGNEGIYIATIRSIVHDAAFAPAMGSRKVFIVGDAEQMGFQEGSEYAANAFLKLLEEPPANTWVIITSSEPGALLPTIRSRTAAVRITRLDEPSMRKFASDPVVREALKAAGSTQSVNESIAMADGAPGNLFGDDARARAMSAARKLIEAASSRLVSDRHAAALAVGASGARGGFSDILDALVILLGERMRAALYDDNQAQALAVSRLADKVGEARVLAIGNVNPQLITASLLHDLSVALHD